MSLQPEILTSELLLDVGPSAARHPNGRSTAPSSSIHRRMYDRLLRSGHAGAELRRLTAVVADAVAARPSLIKASDFQLLAESNLQFLEDRAIALAGMAPIGQS